MFRKICFFLGLVAFLAGIFLLIRSEINPLGAVIGITALNYSQIPLAGIFLLVISVILFFVGKGTLEEKIKVTSSIDKDPALVRLAARATRNETIQRDMDHLLVELQKGNLTPGFGRPGHVEGTDIFYLRGSEGARLFYRQTAYGYEVVGKANGSGKKNNEASVIQKLEELYGR